MENKFYLTAPIEIQKETAELREKASKVIELPTEYEKQPDLLYFSAIFVSSGENLNHAYFLGSELVAARDTIVNKALDVEHSEDEIIGHLYQRAYIDKDGKPLDVKELASRETAGLDKQDMHIAIAGIIYKNRFPNLAEEVASGKWSAVSMECYYKDYDIKIGELVLERKEAEALGLASADSVIGKIAKIIKGGKEIAEGAVTRVLRGICFSGCGIVKNPANPPSVIMETANSKDKIKSDEIIILNYDELEEESNNLTSNKVAEARDGNLDDSVGICVNFKRRVLDKDGSETASDWCSAYEAKCSSFSRDTTDPDCLRNRELQGIVASYLEEALDWKEQDRRSKELLGGLKAALREAVKTRSR